jgi:hypothetical protein
MVGDLAYLAGFFIHMNQLNKFLQGPGQVIFTSSEKIFGLKRKINFWKNHVVKGNLEMLSLLLELESEGYQGVSCLI